ncbi:hypothetical protein [Streptomyces sp. NBC_00691]|uniref:hypothetical protein n=1 Tax=Streptomyces sp. NBC_00691 TaxID=2903671 RepID=UPI002E34A9D7|nr:hypothetical protein [Streptomyces sp. NBC_00691]
MDLPEIPGVFRWVAFAVVALHLLSLVPLLRRVRRSEPGARTGRVLDLVDSATGLTLLVGLLLGSGVLLFVGLAAMGAVILAKGVRRFRIQREA